MTKTKKAVAFALHVYRIHSPFRNDLDVCSLSGQVTDHSNACTQHHQQIASIIEAVGGTLKERVQRAGASAAEYLHVRAAALTAHQRNRKTHVPVAEMVVSVCKYT